MVLAVLITEIFNRFIELAEAPLVYKEMLWIIIPLLLTMLLMELYFGRYKYEELGWNTAYGNALVLIFVAVDLFRWLYMNDMLTYLHLKNVLAIAVVFEGILLTLINFLHLLPKEVAFGVSSKLPMNFIAYTAVILIYSNIPIDWITLAASILFLVAMAVFIKLVQLIIPASVEEEEAVE